MNAHLRVLLLIVCLISLNAIAFAGPMDDLLINSVSSGNMAMVKTALANRADVNYRPTEYTTTPLMIAIRRNNAELVQYLLNNGADANLQSLSGNFVQTPLNIAIISDNSKIVNQLINAGANVNITSKNEYYPLTLAINNSCNFQIINLLVSKNANVNLEKDGYTPLMAAARFQNGYGGVMYKQNKLQTAKLLLKNGADPSFVNYNTKKTALQYAIDTGFVDMINLLLPISPK